MAAMVRTSCRMRVCLSLLVLNIAFIWGNSLMPGEVSGAISQWVKNLLDAIFGGGAGFEPQGHGLLRKLAHFTEFTCLGMVLSWLFGMLRRAQWLPVLLGTLVACVDETIQIFVPDRGPGIFDVGIDALGVCLGSVLIYLFVMHKCKRRK